MKFAHTLFPTKSRSYQIRSLGNLNQKTFIKSASSQTLPQWLTFARMETLISAIKRRSEAIGKTTTIKLFR